LDQSTTKLQLEHGTLTTLHLSKSVPPSVSSTRSCSSANSVVASWRVVTGAKL
jgi:hypothetical protein